MDKPANMLCENNRFNSIYSSIPPINRAQAYMLFIKISYCNVSILIICLASSIPEAQSKRH